MVNIIVLANYVFIVSSKNGSSWSELWCSGTSFKDKIIIKNSLEVLKIFANCFSKQVLDSGATFTLTRMQLSEVKF
ncbi:hypothetical protein TNCT_203651 [Trichonephila clavata]|uniref:Uncharacterized protein n=1 Tax=Trichonephila clavata TaxID=2740835 RepID=A0A8X6KCF3_TRICU|nr:hypothetical protein TNCT_203651 [Trichonephila clavata]